MEACNRVVMRHPSIVICGGSARAVLRVVDDFGFQSLDLLSPPRRLLAPDSTVPLVEPNVDSRRVEALSLSSALLDQLPEGETWLNVSARTVARLFASYLVSEDPQRRLDAHKAATLMHQVSLVQHVLSNQNLRRVLIADEVGLGKTIEAGLIIKRLIAERSGLRVLYLAPARLVGNVVHELREKLDLDARRWVAGTEGDARIESDRIVVASIHKAVFGDNFEKVANSGPWDVVIVDECHHLSDWDPAGGKPNQGFRLVGLLAKNLPPDGRLLLMSGTPHQGSEARFSNVLRLLSDDGKNIHGAAGRVIYRTKDRVRDWRGKPLFPAREIRRPTVVQLGPDYERWYLAVGALYEQPGPSGSQARATGWAKGQALQWAASSVPAGLGFLVRLGIRRLGWKLTNESLRQALSSLRPYRGGQTEEPLTSLYERIVRQIGNQALDQNEEGDGEDWDPDEWRPNGEILASLLVEGVRLLGTGAAREKWDAVSRIIDAADGEKIVLFAQPVETVTVVADYLHQRFGQKPAIIVGNQSEAERQEQVEQFQSSDGTRFLVSSRAGGEGLNMQRARRLIHLDVPWNPMELEQRIGRIHRFGSRKTVLVDTVVAAGSREVDMYRIAREKLAMIATHLDPEQFETLFSRVMSLVPPKELEGILGEISAGPFTNAASTEIGRLVSEGYRSWSTFDETYRSQAEQIRTINPGEATWADVQNFLTKHAGASSSGAASFTAFEFQEEEIVAVDETVPTILLGNRLFACGDTGGLRAEMVGGKQVYQLGLNVPEVQEMLRAHFLPEKSYGAAYLKRPADLPFLGSTKEPVVLFAFLRQTLQQELGRWFERTVSFHLFCHMPDADPIELESGHRADVIRACLSAQRIKDPKQVYGLAKRDTVEADLTLKLRRPTSDEIGAGIRHGVWPLAVLILT